MFPTIDRKDPRYDALLRGHNLRFPAQPGSAPARIAMCSTADEAAHALQQAVSAGVRPTIRSGGHCYENFSAYNPGGTLIDLSLMNGVHEDDAYCIAPGAVLGDAYQALYKRYGLTLPGGSCYTVGAGGHISGGGYGLLSRRYGLSSDWLSAVDILTVSPSGHVEQRRVDRSHDPDLFRACRGAGAGGFGLITSFRFEKLPPAPREVVVTSLHFPWGSMDQASFADLLATYGDYWMTRGKDPDTHGLFVIFEIGARGPDAELGMHIQYCQPDGETRDRAVLSEFLDRFRRWQPETGGGRRDGPARPFTAASDLPSASWLEATISGGGGYGGSRAKYKSAYMKRTFQPEEARIIYDFYSSKIGTAHASVISVDSYGGAVNRPELVQETSIAQRSSVMKLQWQCYWRDPSDDAQRLRELDAFYTSLYTGSHVDADHQGTPWGDGYEGCYMNYPDVDMMRYKFWPELYHGREGLYPFLQSVKRRYDSNNIFHNAMSVQPA